MKVNELRRWLSQVKSQGLVEYALILALIAIVAIVAIQFLGVAITAALSSVGESV